MSADVGFPKEEEEKELKNHKIFSKKDQKPTPTSLFTFQHLIALALIILLSSTGLVSIEDFVFVVFSLIYIFFLSKIAFTSLYTKIEPPVFDEKPMRILMVYVSFAAVIGLFLPIAYILEGVFVGDQEGVKAASPHLFLLASQVFMEGVAFGGGFSLPIRVFVPVFYNSKRIFTLVEWLRFEIYKVDFQDSGSVRRLYVGRVLAMANMALWCFNLFGFLLPIYLPKAFKIHYSGVEHKE